MPHTRSAKKNLRKSEKRRLRNRAAKRTIKTHCKRVVAAAADATPEKLREEFILAVRKLDKAAAKRVIHPNLAARKKSQLARLLNQKLAATPPAPQQPAQ
jgi:small subunit ribosomal protein S20